MPTQAPESSFSSVPSDPAAHGEPFTSSEMIILLGDTGSGKSTFISLASTTMDETKKPRVGHGLRSVTLSVSAYTIEDPTHPDIAITLVDTPGFSPSSSDVTDKDILQRLLVWLNNQNPRVKLSIIYLIDPVQRIEGPFLRHMRSTFLASFPVVFAITYWGGPSSHKQSFEDNFKDRLPQDHHLIQFDEQSTACVWKIIHCVLDIKPTIPLDKFTQFVEEYLGSKQTSKPRKSRSIFYRLRKAFKFFM